MCYLMSSGMGKFAQQMQIITGPHPVSKHKRYPLAPGFPLPPAPDRQSWQEAEKPWQDSPISLGHRPWEHTADGDLLRSVRPPWQNVPGTWIGGGLEALFHIPVTHEPSVVLPVLHGDGRCNALP